MVSKEIAGNTVPSLYKGRCNDYYVHLRLAQMEAPNRVGCLESGYIWI